jgi:hypothetical protein
VEYKSCDSAILPVSIRAKFGLVLTHIDLLGSVDMNKDTCVIETNKCTFLSQFIQIICPLHVSKRVTIHHQEAVTVYAAYGIYHAAALTSC